MSEKAYLIGKCPKCMEELRVPEGLSAFSCMYCGARLSPEELILEAPPIATALPPDAAQIEAEFESDVAARLVGCVTNYAGYNQKITRDTFIPAFEAYEAGCAPVFRELDRLFDMRFAPQTLTQRAVLRLLDDLEAHWKNDKRWAKKSTQKVMIDDDKIIIAIFLVPMVRKLQLSVSEPFVTALQAEWMKRHPDSPFYLGDYDSIAGGFRKKILGLCFITTAVCRSRGLPDDCAELTAFRAFRDGYLRTCPDGAALIDEYYNIAPAIVTCIDLCENSSEKYEDIRTTYLDACYADILAGRNRECKARYVKMVRELQKTYLS